jgi:hypothetical protein
LAAAQPLDRPGAHRPHASGPTGSIGLARLGHWPAVAGYAGFVWFQMVSLYPDDPAVLAQVALAYWVVIFLLAVAEGEDWLDKGEFLTVLFGFIAKVAPLWRADGQTHPPDARLARHAGSGNAAAHRRRRWSSSALRLRR